VNLFILFHIESVVQVDYEGVRKYHDPVSGIDETLVDPRKTLSVSKEQASVYVTRLIPATVYSFNVSASFIDGTWGPSVHLHAETSSDGQPPSVVYWFTAK